MVADASLAILGWTRVAILIACFAGAAHLDNKQRSVPNSYWKVWIKSAVLLWLLEIAIRTDDWITYCTMAAVLAYGSTSLIGTPTITDLKRGSWVDWSVLLWYCIGMYGVIYGIMEYIPKDDFISILTFSKNSTEGIWLQTILVIPVMFFIKMAWKLRLLHGGADAKALLLVAVLIPSWITFTPVNGSTFVPPVFALLVWGGLGFFLLPISLIVHNIVDGNVKTFDDITMIWHATRMPLDEITDNFVWLLDEVVISPDGEPNIVSSLTPPKKTPSREELMIKIEELRLMDVEDAWVTKKYPLLSYIFPGTILLLFFGDPIWWFLHLAGLT
tara:strand:+ start:453 stop:1442 length:990 start_codon:yes stop_codon:yes gene_type:complete